MKNVVNMFTCIKARTASAQWSINTEMMLLRRRFNGHNTREEKCADLHYSLVSSKPVIQRARQTTRRHNYTRKHTQKTALQ